MTKLPIQLPDGLLLRSATSRDRESFVALQAGAHADADGKPSAAVAAWSADLFDCEHPTMRLADITVVEDLQTGELVSALTLVPQKWTYAGVSFGVGRLELVATHADYRRRGLMRPQFEVLHERSAARGDLMQVITDLMFFHHEFDYQSAFTQRAGRGGWTHALPPTPPGGEPVSLRLAALGDIGFLRDVDRFARSHSLLACPREDSLWEYELTGRSRDSMVYDKIFIVEQGTTPVGYVLVGYGGIPSFSIPSWLPGIPGPEPVASISGFELLPSVSWWDIAPSVVRQLTGDTGYMLWLGRDHRAYRALGNLLVRRPPDIGWFVRIPDSARFISHIAPVLEQRLADSVFHGFTGTLRLHFYTYGLQMNFSEGHLIQALNWPEHSRRASDASMSVSMFLSILLGHADIKELAPAYPDHRMQTRLGEELLPVLFPKQLSHIWPLI